MNNNNMIYLANISNNMTTNIPIKEGTTFTISSDNLSSYLKLLDKYNIEIYKKNQNKLSIKVLEKKDVYDYVPVLVKIK